MVCLKFSIVPVLIEWHGVFPPWLLALDCKEYCGYQGLECEGAWPTEDAVINEYEQRQINSGPAQGKCVPGKVNTDPVDCLKSHHMQTCICAMPINATKTLTSKR